MLAGLIGIMLFFFALAPSRAETRATTEVAIAIAVLLFLCAFLGIWQYRRNRRSLRTILGADRTKCCVAYAALLKTLCLVQNPQLTGQSFEQASALVARMIFADFKQR